MKRFKKIILIVLVFFVGAGACIDKANAAIIDTYIEDFDAREDDATINGVDSWSVDQGENSGAVTQDSTTYTGNGKASLPVCGRNSYPTCVNPPSPLSICVSRSAGCIFSVMRHDHFRIPFPSLLYMARSIIPSPLKSAV